MEYATYAVPLAPTGLKTGTYNASPGDLAEIDASGASATVNLPAAPVDQAVVLVKMMKQDAGKTHTVTVNAQGSDQIGANGATSDTLVLAGQAGVYQYAAVAGIWIKWGADLPLSQLDSRYALIDTTAADIQPLGSQAAGSVGKAADAGHVHPTTGLTAIDSITGDIAASPGTAAAGSVGKAADAGHVHPAPAAFAPAGLTGATQPSRYVGATASGAPASGTFATGDFVITQAGNMFVCTAAGTPGTWVKIGQLDTTAGDIAAIGTAAAAGSVGKAADAGHVHAPGQAASSSSAPAVTAMTTTSTSLVMMGVGETITPAMTGKVLAIITGQVTNAVAGITVMAGARYGTGSAPAEGAAVTGTRFGGVAEQTSHGSTAGIGATFAFAQVITGLALGTPVWIDLCLDTANASDAASVLTVAATLIELPS